MWNNKLNYQNELKIKIKMDIFQLQITAWEEFCVSSSSQLSADITPALAAIVHAASCK